MIAMAFVAGFFFSTVILSLDGDKRPRLLDDLCPLAEVQFADGKTAYGIRRLFRDVSIEVGVVKKVTSHARALLPESAGFFVRDRVTGVIVSQGLSSDDIKTVLPWAVSDIERLLKQQEDVL